MECPYCKGEMEIGFINALKGVVIYWQSEEKITHKLELSNKAITFGLKRPKVNEVYYCKECEILIKKLDNKRQ